MYTSSLKLLLLLSVLFLFTACEEKVIVKIHNKKILKTKLQCMNLLVFPPNENIENTLNKLYSFKSECPLTLHISYKNAIVCNSSFNASRKAAGMPNSYLRLELKEGSKLYYSYYVDLDDILGEAQLEDGFSRLKKDLL